VCNYKRNNGNFDYFFIAVSLSFDSFAVSVSTGLIIYRIKFLQAVKVAIVLTLFQSLMPLIGWFLGKELAVVISDFDHWIAFILLSFIGFLMIRESKKNDEEKNEKINPLKLKTMISMGVATSIDALIVGITLGVIGNKIFISVAIIGIVTFFAAMLGMLFGKKIGSKFGKKIEIFGGIILIIIGLKILITHLFL